jgi:hypothetical protein
MVNFEAHAGRNNLIIGIISIVPVPFVICAAFISFRAYRIQSRAHRNLNYSCNDRIR